MGLIKAHSTTRDDFYCVRVHLPTVGIDRICKVPNFAEVQEGDRICMDHRDQHVGVDVLEVGDMTMIEHEKYFNHRWALPYTHLSHFEILDAEDLDILDRLNRERVQFIKASAREQLEVYLTA